jgi:hypothetical protein
LPAAVATAGFVMFAGSSAAYAVTDNHDGTVTVSVTEASGIDGANAALKKLGDNVVVVPVRAGCPSLDSFTQGVPLDAPAAMTMAMAADLASSGPVTVNVKGIPAGYTALVAVAPAGGNMRVGAMVLTKKAAPSCVSLSAVPVIRTRDSGVKSTTGAGGGSGLMAQTKP